MPIRRAIAPATAALLFFASTARAQQFTMIVGDSSATQFDARGATPISETAVLHFALEPNPGGGARLGYVVVIRGPAGWYRQPTQHVKETPAPSIEAERWTVGGREYMIGYSPLLQRLFTFGEEVDLKHSPIVLVTLGTAPCAAAIVEPGPVSRFVLDRPGEFADAFLAATPEVRSFAGMP